LIGELHPKKKPKVFENIEKVKEDIDIETL